MQQICQKMSRAPILLLWTVGTDIFWEFMNPSNQKIITTALLLLRNCCGQWELRARRNLRHQGRWRRSHHYYYCLENYFVNVLRFLESRR